MGLGVLGKPVWPCWLTGWMSLALSVLRRWQMFDGPSLSRLCGSVIQTPVVISNSLPLLWASRTYLPLLRAACHVVDCRRSCDNALNERVSGSFCNF